MEELTNYSIAEFPSCAEIPLWLWKVDPIDGESLTSWVARLSGKLQVPIQALIGSFNLSDAEARADLDVFPPCKLISGLSLRTGVMEEKIRLMTLTSLLPRIIREQDQERLIRSGSRPRHLPWILPNGWQSPKYALMRHGGTPYCPQCLMEDTHPHLRFMNRLSPMVVCPRHQVPLREDCPICGSPTLTWALSQVIQEASGGFPFCWICSEDKANGQAKVRMRQYQYDPFAESANIHSLLRFQELFIEAITKNEVRIPQLGRSSGSRFLQGLRHALSAFNALAYRGLDPRTAKPSADPHRIRSRQGNVRRLAFDFHPMSYRLKLTAWLAWLTERPLDRWPILFRVSFMPSQLPRNWRHPWEAVEENGQTVLGYRFDENNLVATRKVGPEFFRDFFRVADQINLTDREMTQLLGGVSERTIQRWRIQPIMFVRHEPLRRMDKMVDIWDGLKLFAGNKGMAKAWLRTANQSPLFQGEAPLELLLNPDRVDGFDTLASFFQGPEAKPKQPDKVSANLPTSALHPVK